MKLEGIHHITAITADAQSNVDFYAGTMGLRLVKKTVNQDNPTVYHLFFADEKGSAGSDLTFFEFPGVPPGRAGAGDVHRIVWRVASHAALDFWEERLAAGGIESERAGGGLRFADPEGLAHELAVVEVADEPLVADHPEVPAGHALRGFHAVCAYSGAPDASHSLLEALEFESLGEETWEARGASRGGLYVYEQPPEERSLQGAGSVHHVAWASTLDEHEQWRDRAISAGAHPTPVIDRFYFRSIYFREPSGVLFEIATLGPGFTVDEPIEHLGEKLSLPPDFEHLRAEVEPKLRPVVNPRTVSAGVSGNFVWRDAGRTVVFRESGVHDAPQLLAENGMERFDLLSTERHLAGAKRLTSAAATVHDVPAAASAATGVTAAAAELLDRVDAPALVALGGGRTIDTAKAIASVTGARVAAIPTTMSGAEMTGIHRLPAGAEDRVRALVRPSLVIADPEAMTSAPEAELRASSMNALAHGADSLYTPFANPVSEMTALRGAELIATALDEDPAERGSEALALGSILCGYAIDSGAFALHHVACQTLARVCGTPHAGTNAAILPRAMAFMVPRAPDGLAPLARALESEPAEIEPRLLHLGGNPPGLGALGADPSKLPQALESMLMRPELAFTPGGPPTRSDLEALVERSW